MLAMMYGVLTPAAEQQKDAGSSQESGKQKNAKNSGFTDMDQPVDPSQYVGAETCRTCHEQVAAGYDKGPHSKTSAKHEGPQWQGCEACHGPGKAHAESADPDKIIRPGALSRVESSKRCMGCHEFAQEHANFLRSEHLKNNVGCIDCHAIHEPRVEARLLKATMPQLCYSCHLEVKTDSCKPFHRGVTQGLAACNDCHNPHDGHAGSDQQRPKT
jgi:DmsE family decaheme c-type cytochrome